MTAEPDLLPLPDPTRWCITGAEQQAMLCEWATNYARANVAHATAALQAEIEALRAALEEAEEAMRFVHASCATFPQEPQHVQNTAWRRIVNAITKARAVLEQEEGNGQ